MTCFPHTDSSINTSLVLSDKVGHTSCGLFSASVPSIMPLVSFESNHLMYLSTGLWILKGGNCNLFIFVSCVSHFLSRSSCLSLFPSIFHRGLDSKMTTVKATTDFPDDPVVETSPSDVGDVGSISGRELRSHIPHGQTTKTRKRSNMRTNSIPHQKKKNLKQQ